MTFEFLLEEFNFYRKYWDGLKFQQGQPNLTSYQFSHIIVIEEEFIWENISGKWGWMINWDQYNTILKKGESDFLFVPQFGKNKSGHSTIYLKVYYSPW